MRYKSLFISLPLSTKQENENETPTAPSSNYLQDPQMIWKRRVLHFTVSWSKKVQQFRTGQFTARLIWTAECVNDYPHKKKKKEKTEKKKKQTETLTTNSFEVKVRQAFHVHQSAHDGHMRSILLLRKNYFGSCCFESCPREQIRFYKINNSNLSGLVTDFFDSDMVLDLDK